MTMPETDSDLRSPATEPGPDPRTATSVPTSGAQDYALVGVGLAVHGLTLNYLLQHPGDATTPPTALLLPIFAQVGLVGVSWLLMLVFRNYVVIAGQNSGRYFLRYVDDPPADWVERPARTYNNLMQAPTLFYVLCLLAIATGRCDKAQLNVAWLFVALRYAHALIYIMWNHLPSRFGTFIASFVTLAALWWRFAVQTQDLWR